MSKAGDVALQATCDGFDSHNFHKDTSTKSQNPNSNLDAFSA